MRPVQFLLLLSLFVALPLVLTCFSLIHSARASSEPLDPSFRPRQSRLRALFSFTTPSSLFPPSAVISLTNDNSTFFLARPAAFGPSLPSPGLSGQLWVGKGFGEEIVLSDEEIRIHGYELGCSDVPGWNEEHRLKAENGAIKSQTGKSNPHSPKTASKISRSKRSEDPAVVVEDVLVADGTDDHLHQPLPDSNAALNTEPGEPADAILNRGSTPTHADIESLQESADIAGKIVMLSRGGCGFLEKVKWAQRRGGVALIVGDNQPGGQLTIMYAKGDTSNVTIPSLFTSYNAAHLLSSLVPPERKIEDENDSSTSGKVTSVGKSKSGNGIDKPRGSEHHRNAATRSRTSKSNDDAEPNNEWMQNVLSAVGLSDEGTDPDDSRRPPSSGNIDWVLLKDWDEANAEATSSVSSVQQKSVTKSTAPTSKSMPVRGTTTTKRTGNDDFVIGVQDWRDTELIAAKATSTGEIARQSGKQEKQPQQPSPFPTAKAPSESNRKANMITPGSGEYNHQKHNTGKSKKDRNQSVLPGDEVLSEDHRTMRDKFRSFFYHTHERPIVHPKPKDADPMPAIRLSKDQLASHSPQEGADEEGLWVTLTPTSVSTSPFFDTLLVLVISPLVTLTVVYGLLLLRSRIRRRRWRAPKSIVEQLPVRTYHTMSATSSTTSSNVCTPNQSAATSPEMRPSSARSRPRPRSQTTTSVVSAAPEKIDSHHKNRKLKRYNGRQIECVVCLEEYVDGESKVMSLPCGHEFHVECITPWLVTRRRTCPICKGDVVRSLSHHNSGTGGSDSDSTSDGDSLLDVDQTSDGLQNTIAETINNDASAAIPIPARDNEVSNEDIERGDLVSAPLLGTVRAQTSNWRRSLGASINRLSGDTIWRATSAEDRSR